MNSFIDKYFRWPTAIFFACAFIIVSLWADHIGETRIFVTAGWFAWPIFFIGVAFLSDLERKPSTKLCEFR